MCLGFVLAASEPEQCPRTVGLLAESYNPHVRYGAAMAVGIAASGTGSREAVALLEPMLKDSVDFVQQGALIAMALVLVEQPEARQRMLRARIESLNGNRGAETMARMGAIMAAGILDAGGRNATLGLRSESGYFRRTAVVGLALFLQYWYWYPLSYTLSLALHPTALIGVDATLAAPKDFEARCNCRPSTFAYPPSVATGDKKAKAKLPTAVLSTTARAKARAAVKKDIASAAAAASGMNDAMETDEKKQDAKGEEEENAVVEKKEKEKSARESEPTSFILENPARVVHSQRRFVVFDPEQRWQPVRPAPSGFVVLRNAAPNQPVEYLFQEEKPAPEQEETAVMEGGAGGEQPAPAGTGEGDEPAPPEPFEYIPS